MDVRGNNRCGSCGKKGMDVLVAGGMEAQQKLGCCYSATRLGGGDTCGLVAGGLQSLSLFLSQHEMMSSIEGNTDWSWEFDYYETTLYSLYCTMQRRPVFRACWLFALCWPALRNHYKQQVISCLSKIQVLPPSNFSHLPYFLPIIFKLHLIQLSSLLT